MKHKNLPHISMAGYYQFVTFRTYDSLDYYIKKINNLNIDNAKKQYLIDKKLDESVNGAYFYGEVLKFTKEFILSKNTELFDLVSFVIMPNHIHLLFKETIKIDKAMKNLKGTLSYELNKMIGKKGKFFASGYYDKVIRDQKHFEVVYNYIRNNPIKANLNDFDKRYYGIYG